MAGLVIALDTPAVPGVKEGQGLGALLFSLADTQAKSPLAPLWQRGVGGIFSKAEVMSHLK